MRKEKVINMYKMYPELTNKITVLLPSLCCLKGNAEDIFYDILLNYHDKVDEYTLVDIIDLSMQVSLITDLHQLEQTLNILKKLFNCKFEFPDDFSFILRNITQIYDTEFYQLFDCDYEEENDYYKIQLAKCLVDMVSKCTEYDSKKIGLHDYSLIVNSYFDLINDLVNTKVKISEEYSKTLLNRTKIFCDIASDKDIYKLEEDKYEPILNILVYEDDINKLNMLRKLIKIKANLETDELIKYIDGNTKILNKTTINRIYDELEIDITDNEIEIDSAKVSKTAQKILKINKRNFI